MVASASIDELCGNTDRVSHVPKAALDNVLCVQPAADP